MERCRWSRWKCHVQAEGFDGSSLAGEIFHVGVYKPSQGGLRGRYVRRPVGGVRDCRLPGVFALAGMARLGVGHALRAVVVGFWASYPSSTTPVLRISSLPSKRKCTRSPGLRERSCASSMVVIFVIFALAMVLFFYDLFGRGYFENWESSADLAPAIARRRVSQLRGRRGDVKVEQPGRPTADSPESSPEEFGPRTRPAPERPAGGRHPRGGGTPRPARGGRQRIDAWLERIERCADGSWSLGRRWPATEQGPETTTDRGQDQEESEARSELTKKR